jgi:hypothetical protein
MRELRPGQEHDSNFLRSYNIGAEELRPWPRTDSNFLELNCNIGDEGAKALAQNTL